MNITITTSSFGKHDRTPLDLLEQKGIPYTLNPFGRALKKEEIVPLLKNVDACIAGTEQLDSDVLRQLSHLKVISRCGVGLDTVDVSTAQELGIKVFNTPDAPTQSVAELTLGLILALLRKIPLMDREMRQGKWEKRPGNLLSGKCVGIIGFGRIGQKVAQLLKPFGCTITYYDVRDDVPCAYATKVSFNELLTTADIVTLHASGNKTIIGTQEIALLKRNAVIINVARGGVVDENALYTALHNKMIAGAACDVFEQEPYNGKFLQLDNVVLTPHIGSAALESRVQMEIEAVNNLLRGLGIA